jgi:hypothetical protein
MPKFNVNVFYEYALKFNDIEAENAKEAMKIAMEAPLDTCISGPNFTEGLALAGIVDPVGEDGEPDLEKSENFIIQDLTPRKEEDWQKMPVAL